jgi:hypothetical protein
MCHLIESRKPVWTVIPDKVIVVPCWLMGSAVLLASPSVMPACYDEMHKVGSGVIDRCSIIILRRRTMDGCKQVRLTGKVLNSRLHLRAQHALYRDDGRWYHQLTEFPGVLFDRYGYVLFRTRSEFLNNPYLQIGQDVHVPNGIAKLPGYVRCGDFCTGTIK